MDMNQLFKICQVQLWLVWLSWMELNPLNQEVVGLISSQDTGLGSLVRVYMRGSQLMFLSLSLSLPSPL